MMPMGFNSTPLLSYHDIKIEGIELLDDAWGFYPQFSDVIDVLGKVMPFPDKRLTRRLIQKIRKSY